MSLGKDLTTEQEATLEALIDACGLCAVLQSLSTICNVKAEHIRTYSDSSSLARKWDSAAGAIGIAATEPNILAIGCP